MPALCPLLITLFYFVFIFLTSFQFYPVIRCMVVKYFLSVHWLFICFIKSTVCCEKYFMRSIYLFFLWFFWFDTTLSLYLSVSLCVCACVRTHMCTCKLIILFKVTFVHAASYESRFAADIWFSHHQRWWYRDRSFVTCVLGIIVSSTDRTSVYGLCLDLLSCSIGPSVCLLHQFHLFSFSALAGYFEISWYEALILVFYWVILAIRGILWLLS